MNSSGKSIKISFYPLIVFFAFNFNLCAQPDAPALYQQYCAQCHGAELNGGMASSLVDGVWQFGAEDGYIRRNIKHGIPHLGMPSYERTMSDDDIRAVVQYIRETERNKGVVKPSTPQMVETMDYFLEVETFADNLEIPWAIDFLDGNTALITERPGRLRMVKNGVLQSEPVKNTPKVLHEGQGGLMDVAVDPDFEQNGWIYLAYSHALENSKESRPPAMTRVVRGKIENNTWVKEQVLFEAPAETYQATRHHYGCRIVFDPWGHLFFAVGDRGAGYQAQDFTLPNGKVHRIFKDGAVPGDNPFLYDETAMKSLFSLGNRNIQGMAIHPETGELWTTEHGPMGGDELNRIESGKNYGWETITYGRNYNGTIITELTHLPGMEQPVLYWKPSIAVCGLDFYTGDLFGKWKNRLLVGALKYEEVRLLQVEEDRVVHEQVIFKGAGRVRDVSTGPDGAIYVVLNNPGKVVRLTPRE
ncbi:Glucose/arabinose dehydrogenase, beta-propeller fold [Mariniphaga anaerophila]|uniref:Glucose/arabinose dehydrogenase, beta-propeller fold n=1 Tax=Mariniphaga anaerophila TaxID=1484053 RepID=A0A1M5FR95_9BACT|nr:PQQ-dependent sugar dehydrogenase [Mariniphaga anaerophila]SHF93692.1 Glucose/arabinose dehydrogenase, beta-propeller fold [Mariniphaga anaerophila]